MNDKSSTFKILFLFMNPSITSPWEPVLPVVGELVNWFLHIWIWSGLHLPIWLDNFARSCWRHSWYCIRGIERHKFVFMISTLIYIFRSMCGLKYFSNPSVFANGLTQWGSVKLAAVLQTTFLNAFSLIKMYKFWLKFHWSLFLGVPLTVFQHWLR